MVGTICTRYCPVAALLIRPQLKTSPMQPILLLEEESCCGTRPAVVCTAYAFVCLPFAGCRPLELVASRSGGTTRDLCFGVGRDKGRGCSQVCLRGDGEVAQSGW